MKKLIALLLSIILICLSVPANAQSVQPMFVAHRGLQSHAPENTLQGIAAAGTHGFSAVEMDPRLTKDGYWIILHDSKVDRTTNGNGYLYRMTYKKLQRLKIDTPANLVKGTIRVPRLMYAIRDCAKYKMGVSLDGSKFKVNKSNIKYMYSLIVKYKITSKSMISGYSVKDRKIIHKYAPKVYVLWVSEAKRYKADMQEALSYNKIAIVSYNYTQVTEDMVKEFHAAGLKIGASGPKDIEICKRLVAYGVDYVGTDWIEPSMIK